MCCRDGRPTDTPRQDRRAGGGRASSPRTSRLQPQQGPPPWGPRSSSVVKISRRRGSVIRQPNKTDRAPAGNEEGEVTVTQSNIAEWHGKDLLDSSGEKIGKLQDVYVDVETDEPMFGTVKEGFIGRHLTFVPLGGVAFGPDYLQVAVSAELVKAAPNIEMHGDELSQADESTLYHHYQLNYTAPPSASGRRLARR
jgi:hypothetical protein